MTDEITFTAQCGNPDCERTINLLENHVKGHFTVERVIPLFLPDPEGDGEIAQSRLRGRPEADSMFCDGLCLANAVLTLHHKHGLEMLADEGEEFPYGENSTEYQTNSEEHNKVVNIEILRQMREAEAIS